MDAASSTSSGPPQNQRKERGAIAAQACDTCRTRKQKCDEQRPKCGLCQRMKLECRYREPQPTKKDKTMVDMLDRIKSIEGKVDRVEGKIDRVDRHLTGRAPVPTGFGPSQRNPASQPSLNPDIDDPGSASTSNQPTQQSGPTGIGSTQGAYRHASAAHKMLTWPAVQNLLYHSLPPNIGEMKSFEQEGTSFLIQVHRDQPRLPFDDILQQTAFLGMQSQAARTSGAPRVTFPALTRDLMQRLATSYFDTYNFLYPFMDRQNFMSDTLTRVHSEGFDNDNDSVIALLVFALGELAIEGSRGSPIEYHNGRPSGVRGGSPSRPPGLALFNEAKKRVGFVTQCNLEDVQILSLAALYYESCFHHVDFWRMSVQAALHCHVLVTCNTIDWASPRGDLIKRTYWHCAMMETGLYLELDLSPSELTTTVDFEDHIGMPSFNTPFCEADHLGNQSSQFEAHYASQVALRRLCVNLHQALNDPKLGNDNSASGSSSSSSTGAPSAATLKQLASQLAQWRDMLPPDLQWAEDDPTSFPTPQSSNVGNFRQSVDPSLPASSSQNLPLFYVDLDSEPVHYPYAYDIQVALLRTRFYYAKYMVYRPFVYKALHTPDQMTTEDAQGAAECLICCLSWPLPLSPTSRRKRLVPYLFCWSQNFLGVLIIIYMTRHNPMLRSIRTDFCGPRFEEEVDTTVDMMLDWIRDLKSVDPLAQWSWNILQSIYQLEP